jgi:hypothetical protein
MESTQVDPPQSSLSHEKYDLETLGEEETFDDARIAVSPHDSYFS